MERELILSGKILMEDRQNLKGEIRESQAKLTGQVQNGVAVYKPDTYDGPVSITPSDKEQELQTAGKLLEENVVVLEIPIYEVSNNSGGITVNIGG